jgi:hypothetical protein
VFRFRSEQKNPKNASCSQSISKFNSLGVVSVWFAVDFKERFLQSCCLYSELHVDLDPLQKKRFRNFRTNAHFSDGLGGPFGVEIFQIIHVVAHGHEQVKEQFATNLHLHLHSAATLKRLPASNNQS